MLNFKLSALLEISFVSTLTFESGETSTGEQDMKDCMLKNWVKNDGFNSLRQMEICKFVKYKIYLFSFLFIMYDWRIYFTLLDF